MTTITMRYTKGAFLVTGKDIMARTFASRREAQGLVRRSFPGAPIKGDRPGRREAANANRRCSAMTRLEQRGGVSFAVVIFIALVIAVWRVF